MEINMLNAAPLCAVYAMDDRKLFQALRKMAIVDSQYAFSRLLGRNQSYFSVAQARRQPISVAALAYLAAHLRQQAQSATDVSRHVQLHSLAEAVEAQLFKRSSLPRPAARLASPTAA